MWLQHSQAQKVPKSQNCCSMLYVTQTHGHATRMKSMNQIRSARSSYTEIGWIINDVWLFCEDGKNITAHQWEAISWRRRSDSSAHRLPERKWSLCEYKQSSNITEWPQMHTNIQTKVPFSWFHIRSSTIWTFTTAEKVMFVSLNIGNKMWVICHSSKCLF